MIIVRVYHLTFCTVVDIGFLASECHAAMPRTLASCVGGVRLEVC